MIRTAWVTLVGLLATVVFGSIAIVAALFRLRGNTQHWATRQWSRMILRAGGVRTRVYGIENLDLSRGQVVAANHLSWFDVFALAAVIPGRFHFVGKKELGRIPFFGVAWRAAGHIAIDRSNRQSAMQSLRDAASRIQEAPATVILFPEGTRSRAGTLQPFKRGAFHLARFAGVPIVPTAIVGSYEILRPDDWRVHPSEIAIFFESPVDAAELPAGPSDALQEEVHQSIARRLDEEGYSDPGSSLTQV